MRKEMNLLRLLLSLKMINMVLTGRSRVQAFYNGWLPRSKRGKQTGNSPDGQKFRRPRNQVFSANSCRANTGGKEDTRKGKKGEVRGSKSRIR